MSHLTERIRAAANFDIQSERRQFWVLVDDIKEQSQSANTISSTRFVIAIVRQCLTSLANCGEKLWQHAEKELRSDVFFLLSQDEATILRELFSLLHEQKDFYVKEFNSLALKTAQHYSMDVTECLESMDGIVENLMLHYHTHVYQIYEKARGGI